MARIAGVTTQKDVKGNITHVTINVKKHKEALPVLKELGLIEKTKFEKECESGMSVEEFHNGLINHIDKVQFERECQQAISVDEAFNKSLIHVKKTWHEWNNKNNTVR